MNNFRVQYMKYVVECIYGILTWSIYPKIAIFGRKILWKHCAIFGERFPVLDYKTKNDINVTKMQKLYNVHVRHVTLKGNVQFCIFLYVFRLILYIFFSLYLHFTIVKLYMYEWIIIIISIY